MMDLKRRLRAPDYWMSGSSEGHEGDNDAPYEAADRIEELERLLFDTHVWLGKNDLRHLVDAGVLERIDAILGER